MERGHLPRALTGGNHATEWRPNSDPQAVDVIRNPDLTPYTKMNSKWITGSREKCKSTKLPGGNTGENLDLEPGRVPGLDPKHNAEKEVGELDLGTAQGFCSMKDATKDAQSAVVWEGHLRTTRPAENIHSSAATNRQETAADLPLRTDTDGQ